jgi:YggT family protein
MKPALLFLCDTIFSLIVYPLLLRFWMQALRAPFRNPLGDTVLALTNWLVRPLRRIIPGLFGLDLATLLAAFFTRWLWVIAEWAIAGVAIDGSVVGISLAFALLALVKASIYLLMGALIVQALLSWIAPHGPMAGVLNALTFRFLRPFRKWIPPIGGQLDLSPLIVLVLCQLVLLVPIAWLEQFVRSGS